MFYIGIDVAKNTHYASVMNQYGEVILDAFSFPNNHEGFSSFLLKIKKFTTSRHLAGLESTGHYGDNLLHFLLENNIAIGMINPIITDAYRKTQIRKTKTDKIDCSIICRVLMSKDNYVRMTLKKLQLREMKQLTRYRATRVEDMNIYKNRLQKCIDVVFPEYNSLFKTKYSRAYMEVLQSFPGSTAIANAHLTKLKNTLRPKGSGLPVSLSVSTLKEAALDSIGEDNEILSLEIQQLLQNIELIQEQLTIVDKKIEEFAIHSKSPIYSIPGIGNYTGSAILSEIGNIDDFSSSTKLIGYAGVDPSVYQSGEYNAAGTTISKRGSPYLRKALYQVALTICHFNPTFHTYYKRKREQGKSHRCAQGHITRKLLRVIFKLLTENIDFNEALLV